MEHAIHDGFNQHKRSKTSLLLPSIAAGLILGFAGMWHSPSPNILGSIKFIGSAILGNLIGGSFFVAILNYGHIKKTQ